MASYSASAIVLKKTKLGETDVILTLLSSDGSQIRAVAKGARKTRSRFGGRSEPFTHIDVLLHSGRSLEIVSEVRTVNPYAALRDEYTHLLAASVIVDVLEKVSLEGQVDRRLFELTCATFDALCIATPERVEGVLLAFLLKGMAMQGYRPTFEVCASCFDSVETGEGESPLLCTWSSNTGGIVCGQCAHGLVDAVAYPSAATAWLAVLFGQTMAEVAQIDIPTDARNDLYKMVDSFTRAHLPARIKALDFYRSERG